MNVLRRKKWVSILRATLAPISCCRTKSLRNSNSPPFTHTVNFPSIAVILFCSWLAVLGLCVELAVGNRLRHSRNIAIAYVQYTNRLLYRDLFYRSQLNFCKLPLFVHFILFHSFWEFPHYILFYSLRILIFLLLFCSRFFKTAWEML